jgi:hypothetical protein
MKTKLLRNILFLAALSVYSINTLQAQSFTFDSDVEGWVPADASTIVSHSTVDGRSVILIESHPTITRLGGCYGGDNIGEGGLDVCIPNVSPNGTDGISGTADDNIYLKIVFRNNSNGDRLRIATPDGKVNRDASAIDPYTDNPEWPINNDGTNTEWLTSYYNLTNGNFVGSNISIGFHLVNQDSRSDVVTGKIEIDSWELTSTDQWPGALNVKNNTLNDVTLYPNPANDILTVKSPFGSDVTIYNVLGASVKSVKKVDALFKMSISDLSSGLYIVRVTNNNKVFQSKLIKN